MEFKLLDKLPNVKFYEIIDVMEKDSQKVEEFLKTKIKNSFGFVTKEHKDYCRTDYPFKAGKTFIRIGIIEGGPFYMDKGFVICSSTLDWETNRMILEKIFGKRDHWVCPRRGELKK